jgi:peptidyl-prolyl cis-trans isomerase SurA
MFQKTAAKIFLVAIVLPVSVCVAEAQAAQTQTQTRPQPQTNVFQGARNIESIVAWVNTDIILKSEYDKRVTEIRDELTRNNNGKVQGAQLEQAIREQTKHALQELIDESLYRQQAKEMGLTGELEVLKALERMRQERKLPTNEALEKEIVSQGYTVDEVKENLRVQVLRDQVLQREVYSRVVITNDEVRKYYDEHQKDFDRPAGIHLREITVITENRGEEEKASQRKKIEEAQAAVKKGEDFATVAAKYSESSTASEGGDFGFFTKGELSPSLEEIVGKLEKGQVTDVIPVQGALMIIKLDDKHNGGILPFELAQKEIQNILWQKALEPKIKEYLTKLRADGFVKVADGYVDAGTLQAPEKVSEVK